MIIKQLISQKWREKSRLVVQDASLSMLHFLKVAMIPSHMIIQESGYIKNWRVVEPIQSLLEPINIAISDNYNYIIILKYHSITILQ